MHKRLTELFNQKTALIAVDLQDMYCDPKHPMAVNHNMNYQSQHLASIRTAAFIKVARSALSVFYIFHRIEYLGDDCGGEPMFSFPPGNPRELAGKVNYQQGIQNGDCVLTKSGFDAFEGPDLLPKLQEEKIRTLLVAGVTLSECVTATVRSAKNHGFDVIIIDDMVGDPDIASESEMRAYIDKQDWQRVSSAQAVELLRCSP